VFSEDVVAAMVVQLRSALDETRRVRALALPGRRTSNHGGAARSATPDRNDGPTPPNWTAWLRALAADKSVDRLLAYGRG
jgi:hypothetical protein